MDFETVIYAVDGGVARITMNRPERHNALGYQLMDDIDAAFGEAERDPAVRAIVLAGAGRSFCSGYDRKGSYYTTPPADEGHWTLANTLTTMRDIEGRYQRIWDCPKPTIARVHGHALAAGCYLQLLCDISVASTTAQLGHPGVKFGGASSMPLFQVALGLKKARYLLLTGRIIDGIEAERIGLVTMAVPEAELDSTIDGIIADLFTIPANGVMVNKESLNTSLEIMGVGAMFRYQRQINAVSRLREPGT